MSLAECPAGLEAGLPGSFELPPDPTKQFLEAWRLANVGDEAGSPDTGDAEVAYDYGLKTDERVAAIFHEGQERLLTTMPVDGLPSWLNGVVLSGDPEHRTLAEALQIDALAADLEAVRLTGDIAAITLMERGIAERIQFSIGQLPLELETDTPTDVIATGQANSIGLSRLASALMDKVGLRHLVANRGVGSALLLLTANNEVEWRDIRCPWLNEVLSDEMITASKPDGSQLTVADIVAFSGQPASGGLAVTMDEGKYREKFPWKLDEQRVPLITIFEPEQGLRLQALNRLGANLSRDGHREAALVAHRRMVTSSPNSASAYSSLGNSFSLLGHLNEAIIAYRQALAIDASLSNALYGLGYSLYKQRRHELAAHAFGQAVTIEPKLAMGHYALAKTLDHLGRPDEAAKARREYARVTGDQSTTEALPLIV